MTDSRSGLPAVSALVAWKGTDAAKSRLDVEPPLRRRLAEAMALDTLRALAAALPAVAVTTDDPGLGAVLARAGIAAEVLLDDGPGGLNAALVRAEDRLRTAGVRTVVACVADLPTLRAPSVTLLLRASRGMPRSFVADRTGVGTTMLIAHDVALDPRFEGASAAAHRSSGAFDLVAGSVTVPADARWDVDTVADLDAVRRIGVGPATRPLLDAVTGPAHLAASG